jgi:hypothetical protein
VVYVLKFFWWEMGYMGTMDIQVCRMCAVCVPSVCRMCAVGVPSVCRMCAVCLPYVCRMRFCPRFRPWVHGLGTHCYRLNPKPETLKTF